MNNKILKISKEIVNIIANDISDRSGIGDEWDNIDINIQEEIIDEWKEIIIKILTKNYYENDSNSKLSTKIYEKIYNQEMIDIRKTIETLKNNKL